MRREKKAKRKFQREELICEAVKKIALPCVLPSHFDETIFHFLLYLEIQT